MEGGRKRGDYRKDNILIDRLCQGQAWWLWLRQRIPQVIKLEMMKSQYTEYRLSCLIRHLSMMPLGKMEMGEGLIQVQL